MAGHAISTETRKLPFSRDYCWIWWREFKKKPLSINLKNTWLLHLDIADKYPFQGTFVPQELQDFTLLIHPWLQSGLKFGSFWILRVFIVWWKYSKDVSFKVVSLWVCLYIVSGSLKWSSLSRKDNKSESPG